MIVTAIAFYVFAAIAIAAGFMVIASRNPVHSVLFLILTFFNAAALFVLMGAEFIALILLIVYIGAVAVLFLFVVMMLDIDFTELRQGFLQYLPVGALLGLILALELCLVGASWVITPDAIQVAASPLPAFIDQVTNARAIGRVLYTQYVYLFQASGLILFVAMIGAIVLTLRHRTDIKRQVISRQVGRRRDDGVEYHDIKPGQGL